MDIVEGVVNEVGKAAGSKSSLRLPESDLGNLAEGAIDTAAKFIPVVAVTYLVGKGLETMFGSKD